MAESSAHLDGEVPIADSSKSQSALPQSTYPPEISRLIIEHLEIDYRTLSAVALADKFFCEEARRLLYRVFSDEFEEEEPYRSPPPTAFVRNPRLAKYLYSITVHTQFIPSDDPRWAMLCAGPIFHSMRNVKELRIASAAPNYPSHILMCCPFKLRIFQWYHSGGGPDFKNLTLFLRGQDELRELYADHSYPIYSFERQPTPFSPMFCQQLEYLDGNRGIAEMMLPQRKVTMLIWNPIGGDIHTSLDHLSKELNFLKAFSHRDHSTTPLKEFLPHFQNLQFLELDLTSENLPMELDAIYQLPSLIGLILKRRHSDKNPLLLSIPSGVNKFFERCQSSEFIDIEVTPQDQFFPTKRIFERWTRSKPDGESSGQPETIQSANIRDHIRR